MSMQTTDPIADLLTRIRNAKLVGKTEVRVPSSKMKKVIAEQLVKNGYLADVKLEDAKPRGVLVITIKRTSNTVAAHLARSLCARKAQMRIVTKKAASIWTVATCPSVSCR